MSHARGKWSESRTQMGQNDRFENAIDRVDRDDLDAAARLDDTCDASLSRYPAAPGLSPEPLASEGRRGRSPRRNLSELEDERVGLFQQKVEIDPHRAGPARQAVLADEGFVDQNVTRETGDPFHKPENRASMSGRAPNQPRFILFSQHTNMSAR